jgi:hypothetical protein
MKNVNKIVNKLPLVQWKKVETRAAQFLSEEMALREKPNH